MHCSQPAKDKAHDQCPAAGGKCKRKASDHDGEQAHQSAEKNADPDKDHVRRYRLAVGVAEILRCLLDVRVGADQSQEVASLQPNVGCKRHRLSSSR